MIVTLAMTPRPPITTVLCLMACVCVTVLCWGQGTVNFANSPAVFFDGVDRYVYLDFVGGTRLVGTNYVAELWYGSDANSLAAIAPPVAPFRDVMPDSVVAGVWSGDTRTLQGFGSGDVLTLQVKVWDLSLFSTYNQASSSPGAIFGASEAFSYRVPLAGEENPIAYTMINMRAFSLVPEPSGLFVISALLALLFAFRIM